MFHLAQLMVMLRLNKIKPLIYRRHALKIPGVGGRAPGDLNEGRDF